ESVEASGKTIEDAILQALNRLGRTRDEVEVVVLQEPSRGARGMGVREARVRVYVSGDRAPARAGAADDGDYLPDDEAEYADEDDFDEYEEEEEFGEDGDRLSAELTTAALADVMPEDVTTEEVAIEALRMILGHMGVQAEVEVRPASEDEPLTLNVQPLGSQPLSLLIGRRGETLASLQFVVNMIVTKQAGKREHVIVDVQNYRQRREVNLRQMAHRIANQVRQSGAPITLEAMPPNERRIIHMALSESDDIATESTGEGEQRRVVVSLRKGLRV
ncbi:MAG TPA: RNA-binding cell elongation regulator Jag/EloR, partial [Ktedonobacterales bacterium]|nr:RNA-binding cell elongation regulator Jag/EloR [Ktedonobacterales bacterium]